MPRLLSRQNLKPVRPLTSSRMGKTVVQIASVLVALAWASMALAQDEWPAYPIVDHDIPRGPGGYFSTLKLGLIWGLYLLWVLSMDWINRDTQILKLNHQLWNPVNFFPFYVVLLLLTFTVPFLIGFPAAVLAWLVPLGMYILNRNKLVEDHQKVLTPGHFRHLLATRGKKAGINVSSEKQAAHAKGAPVEFKTTAAADEGKNQANLILSRQNEGYVPTKDLIADAIDQRGSKIMLDTGSEQVTVRYQIDGVWHETDPMEREAGDPIVEVLKNLTDTSAKERRKRQAGDFGIKYKDQKCTVSMVSQGTKTGERTILNFVHDGIPFEDLTEAGMRDKLQEKLKAELAKKSGILIFCSVPGGGLSTTVALAGKMSDRYMRDFTSFQNGMKPEPVAENISIEGYDDKSPPLEQLQTLFRKDPDVVIVHDLDKEIAELSFKFAAQDKLVMTTVRAKEAVEALLRILLLKVPASSFAPLVLAVVNQRLIRKLCEDCKEEYEPTPALLKKLGIPKGRIEKLYRPPTDEEAPVCKTCAGLGYFGRTSIFELLIVDDKIREALEKKPKLEVLRKLAKKAGNRSLQDEGVLLVAKGVTSLAELSRALKS